MIINLLSLYNSSILDIEHSPYYIALGQLRSLVVGDVTGLGFIIGC